MNSLQQQILERDLYSCYQPGQPTHTHIAWEARISFDERRLFCVATYRFTRGGVVDMDTRGIEIVDVTDAEGRDVDWLLCPEDPLMGSRLELFVPMESPVIRVHYNTAADSGGLQWLEPIQTAGKVHPYLFSHAQPCNARSYLPCQDTPGIRFTYEAKLTVPAPLRGLMAANAHLRREEAGEVAHEFWEMHHPVPSYLFTFAVGHLASRDLTARTRVWCEPEVVDRAAAELDDVPRMMELAEKQFGTYEWGRFDLLILPPSFPYGGMENPCLAFITPTAINGDKSHASLLIHELSHSWTGNLVTNAQWRDLWLNEGWTTYLQWRIEELFHGKDLTMLEMVLGQHSFTRECEYQGRTRPMLTALAPDLSGVPSDGVMRIAPYFKGAMFLVTIEQRIGREAFDKVIAAYISTFRFRSLSTAAFLDFLAGQLPPGTLEAVGAWRWVYEPGLPENMPPLHSTLAEVAEETARRGALPADEVGNGWHAMQWRRYLSTLPEPADEALVLRLDAHFGLASRPNTEIRWAYLLLAVESGVTAMWPAVGKFLEEFGRLLYVSPLYRGLCETTAGREYARQVYDRVRHTYHPIARGRIDEIFAEAEPGQVGDDPDYVMDPS